MSQVGEEKDLSGEWVTGDGVIDSHWDRLVAFRSSRSEEE